MIDREKVMKGLDRCYRGCPIPVDCPYKDNHKNCFEELLGDTLELLKEQEPKKPRNIEYIGDLATGSCPTCYMRINNCSYLNACGRCGQAVKWE